MLAHYSRIVALLQRCKTDEVSEAERQLKELAVDEIQILSCLQQSLRDLELGKQLHTLAVSKINDIFTCDNTQHNQLVYFKYFSNLLIDPAIPFHYKKELNRSLMNCIEMGNEQHLKMWKEFTLMAVLNEELCQVGLLLLTAFSCSEIKDNLIEELDEKPFEFSLSKLCPRGSSFSQVKQISQCLQAWKVVVQYLIHFSSKFSNALLCSFAMSKSLCECLSQIYNNFSNGNGRHCLYLNVEDENTTEINEMKKVALQLQFMILSQSLKHSSESELYAFTGRQIDIYVNTLCYLSLQRGLIEKFDLQEIAIAMIRILKCMSEDSPTILSKSWKHMIHYMIFPFLEVSESELEDFEDNTGSYIEVSEDCCEKQKMGILKTEAASFLEKISDMSYDILGCVSSVELGNGDTQQAEEKQAVITKYIINFAISSIKHNLSMQFISSRFLEEQGLPDEARPLPVQTAFLVLSIFSYCLENYRNEIEAIRVILCSEHIRKFPPLERARVYTFLAYTQKEVLGSEQNQTVKYWVDLAFSEENHPTVTYCALDFIFNLVHNIYNQSNIKRIITKIARNTCSNFWMLLKKIVLLYCLTLSEALLVQMVDQILRRIQTEIQNEMAQKVKVTHVITNLLLLIRIISEKGEFIADKPQLKSRMWEVNKLYPLSVENNFEEEVIKIINSFLFFAHREDIQNYEMHRFVAEFAAEFEKSEYEPTYYYIAFNNFIMKGDFQTTIKPIYNLVKTGLVFLLEAKRNKNESVYKKLPIAHTLLLLQNILAIHGGMFSVDQLQFLSTAVESLFPQEVQRMANGKIKKKLVIYDRTLLARALNLQFLCYLYFQNPVMIGNLMRYHNFKIFYGYDVSVLISCIRIQVLKEKQLSNFIELMLIAIRVIYSFIQMESVFSEAKSGELDKNKSKIEEDDEGERKGKKNDLVLRIKRSVDCEVILASTNTPFLMNEHKVLGYNKGIKHVKEIREEFMGLLAHLREGNMALLESMVFGFDQGIKQKLRVITSCEIDDILSGNMKKGQENGRKKFRVLGVKLGEVDEVNGDELEQYEEQKERRGGLRMSDDEEDSDEDIKIIKCQRAKKKEKLKSTFKSPSK